MHELVIGGTYRHYKNKLYIVKSVARHSETLTELVIYEAQYENKLGKLWARPKEMFLEDVTVGAYQGPRFTFVE